MRLKIAVSLVRFQFWAPFFDLRDFLPPLLEFSKNVGSAGFSAICHACPVAFCLLLLPVPWYLLRRYNSVRMVIDRLRKIAQTVMRALLYKHKDMFIS
jgi:hypothetical protein